MDEETGDVTVTQGREIGFPSVIRLTWEGGAMRLGGTVVRDDVRVLDD